MVSIHALTIAIVACAAVVAVVPRDWWAATLACAAVVLCVLSTGSWAPGFLVAAVGMWWIDRHDPTAAPWRAARIGLVLVLVGWVLWVKASIALDGHVAAVPYLVPMGLSFFALQAVGFLVDGARRGQPGERSVAMVVSFALLPPVRLAGPVLRGDRVLDQWGKAPSTRPGGRGAGLGLIVLGLAKKRLFADVAVAMVHRDVAAAGGWHRVAVGAVTVAAAYLDASGYADIAVGCGRLMGLSLPGTFADPLTKATSLTELWRRWQVPLMGWFRDYVYRPVQERVGRHRANAASIALAASFAASTLWHGLHPVWFGWGAVTVGVLLVEQRVLRWLSGQSVRLQAIARGCRRVFVWAYLAGLLTLLAGLQARPVARVASWLPHVDAWWRVGALAAVLVLVVVASDAVRQRLVRLPSSPLVVVCGIVATGLLLAMPGSMSPFVYQAF